MKGGQIAALIAAIVLFFPGSCFLVLGTGFSFDAESTFEDVGFDLILGIGLLAGVGFLGWFAFRKRPSPPAGAGVR